MTRAEALAILRRRAPKLVRTEPVELPAMLLGMDVPDDVLELHRALRPGTFDGWLVARPLTHSRGGDDVATSTQQRRPFYAGLRDALIVGFAEPDTDVLWRGGGIFGLTREEQEDELGEDLCVVFATALTEGIPPLLVPDRPHRIRP